MRRNACFASALRVYLLVAVANFGNACHWLASETLPELQPAAANSSGGTSERPLGNGQGRSAPRLWRSSRPGQPGDLRRNGEAKQAHLAEAKFAAIAESGVRPRLRDRNRAEGEGPLWAKTNHSSLHLQQVKLQI